MKFKRLLCLLLAFSLIFCLLAGAGTQAFAAEQTEPAENAISLVRGFYFESNPASEGWTFTETDKDGYSWIWSKYYTYDNLLAYEGSGAIISQSYVNGGKGPVHCDNWAISPAITLPAGYSGAVFYATSYGDYGDERFTVHVGTSPTPSKMTQMIPSTPATYHSGSNAAYFDRYTVDLTEFAGKTIYIAIRHFDSYDHYLLGIDSLEIYNSTNAPVVPENPRFLDVYNSDYFYAPVMWAVQNDITQGTDAKHFSPNATCTRAQVVTFLWRAMGCPEPSSYSNPFTDVKSGDYYYKAVLWAVQNGITKGTGATTFGPNQGCTRSQVVTFLWRAQGGPGSGSSSNPFVDVKSSDYYYDAVLWAVKHGITQGTDSTHFSPNASCTRGQIVTFLYRAL